MPGFAVLAAEGPCADSCLPGAARVHVGAAELAERASLGASAKGVGVQFPDTHQWEMSRAGTRAAAKAIS